jgi:hypothetical protein
VEGSTIKYYQAGEMALTAGLLASPTQLQRMPLETVLQACADVAVY